LLPTTLSIIASISRFGKRLRIRAITLRLTDLGRREFRPQRNEQQDAKTRNSLNYSAERFGGLSGQTSCGVVMDVLDHGP
jgi:hypothetical protein